MNAGDVLGPYVIESRLGQGGMGEVYRARDSRLQRSVAVKVLPAHLAQSEEFRRRFEREARAISRLNHPHICSLHDVGAEGGIDYFVMECIEGESLQQRLQRGPLGRPDFFRHAIDIAAALEHAHRAGVIHRDLKPANVMLTPVAGIKVLDFGLAALLAGPSTPIGDATVTDLTEAGMVVGTPQYMSPEQVIGKEADARSDIFALGCILFEMATGRKAFAEADRRELAAAILTGPPPSLAPDGDPALDYLISRCLAKNPDDRWQTAHDVKLQLEWLAGASAQTAVPPAVPTTSRLPRILAAAVFLMAVAGAWLAVSHWTGGEHPAPAVRSSLLPPPGLTFVPYNFALSPDGARLAFVAVGGDGKATLWVRGLSAANAQQINGTDRASFPFWAPDSHQIGFFADSKLKAVDVSSGALRTLCDAQSGRGGTWGPDGTIVFAPYVFGPLMRLPAGGASPLPATAIPHAGSGQAHRWPVFLPDGEHFLYYTDWSSPADAQQDGVYLGSLNGGAGKLLSAELRGMVQGASGNLLYIRQSNLLAQPFDARGLAFAGPPVTVAQQEALMDLSLSQTGFSASQNGTLVFQSAGDSRSHLTWFDSGGKALGELPDTTFANPALSPDGKRVAVLSDDERSGRRYVRMYDLERAIGTRLSEGGDETDPFWSRDGKHVYYGARSGSSYGVYAAAADGSGAKEILKVERRISPNDVTADGHILVMDFTRGAPWLDIWSPEEPRLKELAAGAEGQVSPDGKWLAYTGRAGGPFGNILVQPLVTPGAHIQVSSGGGAQARWRRDGRQIFWMQPDKKLMAADFDPATATVGAPQLLFQTRITAPNFATFQYDVAADGRFLINSLPADYAPPLTLITGWPALLNRH